MSLETRAVIKQTRPAPKSGWGNSSKWTPTEHGTYAEWALGWVSTTPSVRVTPRPVFVTWLALIIRNPCVLATLDRHWGISMVGLYSFPMVRGRMHRFQITMVLSNTSVCDGTQCPEHVHDWAGQIPLALWLLFVWCLSPFAPLAIWLKIVCPCTLSDFVLTQAPVPVHLSPPSHPWGDFNGWPAHLSVRACHFSRWFGDGCTGFKSMCWKRCSLRNNKGKPLTFVLH